MKIVKRSLQRSAGEHARPGRCLPRPRGKPWSHEVFQHILFRRSVEKLDARARPATPEGGRGPQFRDSAFTLLECITYMGVLMIIMLLAFQTYERAATSSASLQRNSADIVKALQCGERWREDIRHAIKEPRVMIDGENQTIRIPQKAGEVTYIFKTNAVQRSVDGKVWKQVLSNVKASAMQKDKREHVEAWRWELELKPSKPVKTKPLFTFLAASTLIK